MAESPHVPELVGRVIADRYRLEGVLGRGGMGAVYAGVHTLTNKRVAVKVFHRWVTEHVPQAGARFQREAQAAAAIGHPAIPQVLDAGDDDGLLFLVFEWLEGVDLESALTTKPGIEAERVIEIAIDVLDVLGAAHAEGFVHRDIKPGNIFLHKEDGAVTTKLLDFGAAKRLEPTAQPLTTPGMLIGTMSFMSPEQSVGEEVDVRADLWALGATLFRALAGRPPYVASNQLDLLRSIATTQAASVAISPHPLPRSLVTVIDRALNPHIERRWQDAAAMRAALELCALGPLTGTKLYYQKEEAVPEASFGEAPKTEKAERPNQVTEAAPAAPRRSSSQRYVPTMLVRDPYADEISDQLPPDDESEVAPRPRRRSWLVPAVLGMTALVALLGWALVRSGPDVDQQHSAVVLEPNPIERTIEPPPPTTEAPAWRAETAAETTATETASAASPLPVPAKTTPPAAIPVDSKAAPIAKQTRRRSTRRSKGKRRRRPKKAPAPRAKPTKKAEDPAPSVLHERI